jgi:hypothetical protein
MSADQLLAKALSTDSEDEAIACLRMARKKGFKLGTSNGGHTVESRTQQLRDMIDRYNQLGRDYHTLNGRLNDRNKENDALKKRVTWTRKTAAIGLILSIVVTVTIMHKVSNHRVKALEAEIQQMELVPCSNIFCIMGRSL